MSSIVTKSRISRDTIIYIPVFLAPALINIILLMFFTRVFSPQDYGTYTIVVNATIILSSLLAQWIVLSIQRFRPEYMKHGTIPEFNRHLNQLLLVISIAFLLVVTLFYLFLPGFMRPYQPYYWSSVLLVISSVYFMSLGSVYQVDLQSKQYRNLNVMQSLLKLVMTFVMVMYLQTKAVSFIWATLFAQIVVSIPMLRYVNTIDLFKPLNASKHSFINFVKKFWSYGFPLIGWYIGTTIMNLTDRFMIEYFRSPHEVGIYSANFTIAVQAIALICNPLFFAIQPLLMNEIQEQDDKGHIEARISKFTHLFLIVSLPFGVYFSIYRNEVSALLLGPQFTSGALIIPILIFGFFAWNMGLYGQLTYQIGKRTKEMFYFVTIAALTNFVLNLFFIPKWGFLGASISTTIGFIVYSALLYIFSINYIKWEIPWITFLKVSVLVMILAIPFVILKIKLLAGVSPLISMIIGLPFFLLYIGWVFFFWKDSIKKVLL
ncbi:oligosaccharide flippase family protein [Neobacillus sp. PS2-9]|uniref:lipopolysaccharide biosynthesis protein n=1 Tax=Neobacillus sp. PS2-9 TaxID=3070676 RepID=UPI0027E1D50E|nr:oligosaccharide flippase family protein [Neobacillus sp. PS2-9]WML58587.1 oligosaccharide flippase family protein [Neobacillus sp. PS2-9]